MTGHLHFPPIENKEETQGAAHVIPNPDYTFQRKENPPLEKNTSVCFLFDAPGRGMNPPGGRNRCSLS